MGTVRFGIVRNLITHARPERELAAVLQLSMQLAFRAKEYVAFHAPVIGQIPRGVLNHANSDISKVLRAPIGSPALATMFRSFDL